MAQLIASCAQAVEMSAGSDDQSLSPTVLVEIACCCMLAMGSIAHAVWSYRGSSLKDFWASTLELYKLSETADVQAQMSKHRLEKSVWFVHPVVEALRLLVVMSVAVRGQRLWLGEYLPAPPGVFFPVMLSMLLLVANTSKLVSMGAGTYRALAGITFMVWTKVPVDDPIIAVGQLFTAFRVLIMLMLSPMEFLAWNVGALLVKLLRLCLVTADAARNWWSIGKELLTFLLISLVAAHVANLQAQAAKMVLNAKDLRRMTKATTSLLYARTDAVLQVDENLRIVSPNWRLVGLLGGNMELLSGADFATYLPLEADRQRYQDMCARETNVDDENEEEPVDLINVSIQNHAKSLTFTVQLFHVQIVTEQGRRHMIGISRVSSRAAATEMPAQEEPPPAPAQTLNLPRRPTRKTRSTSGSSRSSRSSRSARSSKASEAGSEDTGGGQARAVVDAMTPNLEIQIATEEFMKFCDPARTPGLTTFFGEQGGAFAAWLQVHISNIDNHSWSPGKFTRLKFRNAVLKSTEDGAKYDVKVTVTLPDPHIVEDLRIAPVTVSFERRRLHVPKPAQKSELAALPESDEAAANEMSDGSEPTETEDVKGTATGTEALT